MKSYHTLKMSYSIVNTIICRLAAFSVLQVPAVAGRPLLHTTTMVRSPTVGLWGGATQPGLEMKMTVFACDVVWPRA